jgi:hypothetical protein
MSAGNYGVVCQKCVVLQGGNPCSTCEFHLARLREHAAISYMQGARSCGNPFEMDSMCKNAIKTADALIDALKGV